MDANGNCCSECQHKGFWKSRCGYYISPAIKLFADEYAELVREVDEVLESAEVAYCSDLITIGTWNQVQADVLAVMAKTYRDWLGISGMSEEELLAAKVQLESILQTSAEVVLV